MPVRLYGKDKSFWPLFWTQFFGALNDNFFKNALVVLVTFKSIHVLGLPTKSLVALLGGAFVLPFFIFSPIAGQLSDRYPKSKIIFWTKLWELFAMALAVVGFFLPNYTFLVCILFLMGMQATFFSPVKYSMLPEVLSEGDLIKGNAYIETGTFLAILVGTILGGLAALNFWLIAGGVMLFALIGIWTAMQVTPTVLAQAGLKINLNPFKEMKVMLNLIQEKKAIFNSVLGISWFWFLGAAILSTLPVYCLEFLRADESVVTAFMAAFTIGIGAGSIACEKLSFHQVEIGLVPIGSLGMSIFLLDISLVGSPVARENLHNLNEFIKEPQSIRLLADFFAMCVFGGFFTVPLYTLIQARSHKESRSQVVAANNVLNAFLMVGASILLLILHHFNTPLPRIFLLLAVVNIAVSIYIYSIVPEFTLRFLSWILVHLFYRIRRIGVEKIPKEGPLILICNHVSFVDWLIIAGAVPRPTRFIMYYKFFDIPVMKYLMRQGRVIPIASAKEDPAILERAMNSVSQALRDGDVICIFPEGQLTRNGELSPFRPGIEKILARDPVPVVPMVLKGLWGSIFSHKDGKALTKIPRKIWFPVTLEVFDPIPSTNVSAQKLQAFVEAKLQ